MLYSAQTLSEVSVYNGDTIRFLEQQCCPGSFACPYLGAMKTELELNRTAKLMDIFGGRKRAVGAEDAMVKVVRFVFGS
jgi:hypothetical protein